MSSPDVVVIGGGNAGLCAALAAQEVGGQVLVLDRGVGESSGGNSRFTLGTMRAVYTDLDSVRTLVPDLSDSEAGSFPEPYGVAQFFDDWARVTNYRADPDLVEVVVRGSFETLTWMRGLGVRFLPHYEWHGAPFQVVGGGVGLIESLTKAAESRGVDIWYGTRAVALQKKKGQVAGVILERGGEVIEIEAGAIVLAAGGFQASSEWRSRHLGPGWDLAPVRGTWTNVGDGIRMGLEVGAQSYGNWNCAHGTFWDLNAPAFGDPRVGDMFKKHSYHLGIMVNATGERFLDEGADFKSYTYAMYGKEILNQPNQMAWQVFDAKVDELLGEEYRMPHATHIRANSLEELAANMEGMDAKATLIQTIKQYNLAVDRSRSFNAEVLDGRGTNGLSPAKSNWANSIDTPPFKAYAVTCGITFTFGGVRVDKHAQVLGHDGQPIPNLYAAGEMVGGLFYHNYPGGTGLTAGAVMGRTAGRSAVLASRNPR